MTSVSSDSPMALYPPHNSYHLHVPLFVLDAVRLFQDHPCFRNGLNLCDIVEMLRKQCFCTGDAEAQVKMAIKELECNGYIRCCNNGYRTLGPLACLALARTPRQLHQAWENVSKLQHASSTSF